MNQPIIALAAHHIRFTVRTLTPIRFHAFKGSALRGAFTSVLGDTFCPEWRAGNRDPSHQALCPACQLVALERDESTSGDMRRPYAITPPPGSQTDFEQGELFSFGMTLFGDALHYLPFLILAVGGMGEIGIGQKDNRGQRGRFDVERIDAINPFSGEIMPMMEPGDTTVYSDTVPVSPEQVLATAELMALDLEQRDNLLRIDFLTPMRLLQNKQLVRKPEFFPLGKQIVLRTMDLCAQHGEGRPVMRGEVAGSIVASSGVADREVTDRPLVLKTDIYPYLDSVRLVEDQTHWWELSGYSARLKQEQQIGGLMGSAIYQAPDWRPLLPWLLWGMSTQVGKNVVKGCGVFSVSTA